MLRLLTTMAVAIVWTQSVSAQSGSTFLTPNLEVSRMPRTISLTPNEENDDFCPYVYRGVDEEDGYLMQREKMLNAQFTALHSWWFGGALPGPFVGLMPVYDRYVLFFGKANDGEQRDDFKRKKLPVSIEEIENWNVGDAVFWASQGGAQFTAGVGWYIATIGARVLVKGGFDHYVEKVGDNKVYVSTGTRKIKTISIMGGVAFNYASLDTLFEKGKARSFEVELVDSEHLAAYRSFIKGDDGPLMSLIDQGSPHVLLIEDVQDRLNGRGSNIGIGANIFITLGAMNFSTRRTWAHEQGETSWGTSRNTYEGRYLRRNSANFLFRWGQNRSQDFRGGVEYSNEENESGEVGDQTAKYFGNLTYTYEANFGKLKKLNRQYKKFLKTTGIDDVCIEIDRGDRAKLRYHRLLHKLKFSEEFISGFANVENLESTLDYFKYEIEGVASMMADDGRKEFCKGARRHKRCRKKLAKKAKKAFKKLARDLRGIVGNSEGIDFAKAFSRLAKHVVKQPVLYRLMYEEGKKCGMTSSFELAGEKIARIYKEQTYPVSDYCYLNNL